MNIHKITNFQQALSRLILNACFIPNIGLFHGRMGCVLFLAVYARHTQNEMYENFASELLDTIYEDLNKELHFNLEDGLCGIGWGIEYLVQQGLMQGDTDEILWEVDQRIMEYNPLRISDLSFRRGLGGLTFYVIARLLAVRETEKIPFDWNYLQSLKTALSQANLSEDPENPIGLKNLFIEVLQGEKHPKIDLPPILKHSNIQLDKEISSFGLDKGIAGFLWGQLLNITICTKGGINHSFIEKGIFIFEEKTRAINYGIGTYIDQLVKTIQTNHLNPIIIQLRSNKTDSFLIEEQDGIKYIYIAPIKNMDFNSDIEKGNTYYYKSIFYLLYPYFIMYKDLFFHLNHMHEGELAQILKKRFPLSKVILTVHYTNWSFQLLGNKSKFHQILINPEEDEYKSIINTFEKEKKLLHSCDKIIAISQHSYKDLVELYQIPSNKITLISHGIKDCFRNLTGDEKIDLRAKYGFQEKEQLILFAGRLDTVKGIELLIKAFVSLISLNPSLHLIIAGEGNFNELLSLATPYWSRITFTGFIEKKVLYDLFSICDIGVLPSLHEEFGYVALEMMMMGLPLIVGKTTGLSELVVHEETGLLVSTVRNELANTIEYLLQSPSVRYKLAKNARKEFIEHYCINKKMSNPNKYITLL
ncbi:MAG: glycosyltransferase [Parabacteroides sp.]|nr:glycosyltransferase [Parabacteroides sp.]